MSKKCANAQKEVLKMYLNLKKEMERNCVTIEDISRSLELHRNTVSNKLNGNTPLSVEEGIKIRNTFFEYIFIEKATFHSLRHTCATDLLQNGTDIATVAAILRDSVATVEETYVHSDEVAKRDAVENLYNAQRFI